MSYQNILSHGTFFYPGWRHYGREVNVVCDRCQTQQLSACIGYAEQDLCLICADELTRGNGTTHIGFPPSRPMQPIRPFRHPLIRPPVNPHDYFTDYK